MAKQKPLGMRIGESVFCAGYLVFAMVAGTRFLTAGGGSKPVFALACSIMTFVLGIGDAFHLVPRIVINVRGETNDPAALEHRAFWLGLGNLVSSITMTAFYLLLFEAMVLFESGYGPAQEGQDVVRLMLCVLAAVRVALCFLPQNNWFGGGDVTWGITRNIPFVIMGIATVLYLVLWYQEWVMAVLVALSFAFYMGVVLFAHKRPMMGMLMIPKTVCYIALIVVLLGKL